MALLYAKPIEHAIRALIYLAVCKDRRPVTSEEIAETEKISSHHLSKVLKILAQKKVVQSLRGPHGGFLLNADPRDITLWDLLGYLGGQEAFDECSMGRAECEGEHPCPLHEVWAPIRDRNKQYLASTTISGLAVAAIEKQRDKYPQFFSI